VKVDTHVHTVFSGASTIRGLGRLVRECYNTPEGVYRRAKSRAWISSPSPITIPSKGR
jgi:hypothetical protein